MGLIIDQLNGDGGAEAVRCPICGHLNLPMQYCRHVRWTFDQGDPLQFARFALDSSPYTQARGFTVRDIPRVWWDEHGEDVFDLVLLHFDACDGYVFGELGDLDLLARDIWKSFRPDPVRPQMARIDPI